MESILETLDEKTIESKQGSTIRAVLEAPKQGLYSVKGYGLKRPANF